MPKTNPPTHASKERTSKKPGNEASSTPPQPIDQAAIVSQASGRSSSSTSDAGTPAVSDPLPLGESTIKPGDEWMHDPGFNTALPPIETKTLTFNRTPTYQMPGTCPVCNAPRLGGTGKIHASYTYRSGNYKHTLALDFPLCEKCSKVQAEFTKLENRASGFAAPFGIAVLVIVILLGIAAKSSELGAYLCGGVFAGGIIWAIAKAIIMPVLTKKFPAHIKERNKRITGAVSIVTFNTTQVTFRFNNAAYADAFTLVNTFGLKEILLNNLTNTLPKK